MDEAAAWAAGAEGERRVAAALADLPPAWTVVHDRLLRPGRSAANLDHIAIGPSGVYFIDAKNRAGRVTEHEGGLFQHRGRDGDRETVSLAAELKKVHGMAAYMAAESGVAVTPVLCLAGARSDEFGAPQMVRGVWVVPVSALSGWLRSRPETMPAESLPGVTARVITDFPSTTTDAALLTAMGAAATAARAPRRSHSRSVPRAANRSARAASRSPRRFVGNVGRLLMLALLAGSILGVAAQLPTMLPAVAERLLDAGTSTASPAPPAPAGRTIPASKPSGAVRSPVAKKAAAVSPAPKPLGPPDCSDATAAEIKAIIHRSVQPVVVRTGCAWGSRLDDPDTQLVSIVMTQNHRDFDIDLSTSVKQQRVVFSDAYDRSYRPGTQASVARGQFIVRGSKPVRARADTVVIVSTAKLGVSDDRARAMAAAIAAAANSGR